MDPQRQYAQLLTLWSQGSKMFRRSRYLDQDGAVSWEKWWRLGRHLVERHLVVLPVPLADPYFLVGVGEQWLTLCPRQTGDIGIAKGLIVAVEDAEVPALSFDGQWVVSLELAQRLGKRGWHTLIQWKSPGRLRVQTLDQAFTLLGALERWPRLFSEISREQWVKASQLMRHPGQRMSSAMELPVQWGFRFDAETGEIWWERQDEDSVHER